jgi:uncharacterized protein (DUF433 family)
MYTLTEASMGSPYIDERNGGYYVAGTRVSLDSVVYNYKAGASPEDIVESFGSLTLAKVYGALAFYLDNKVELDAYLEQGERDFEGAAPPLSQSHPALANRLKRASQDLVGKRG